MLTDRATIKNENERWARSAKIKIILLEKKTKKSYFT